MNEYFTVARITSISGSEGYLNLQLVTDFPENFFSLREVYIDFFGSKKKIVVEDIRRIGKSPKIKFKKFDSFRELEVLVGKDIYIDAVDSVELPEGSFYVHDLIELEVFQENRLLGIIKEVLTLPANDVFVIVDEKGNELMIPFVLNFFEKIDTENRMLILKPGIGRYEDDEN